MVTMLTTKKPEVVDTRLLLGDYITVHDSGLKRSGVYGEAQGDMQVSRESFVQRSKKQRGELYQRTRRQTGTLIDVRQRGAA